MDAIVVHRDVKRKARGFSCAEIRESKLSCSEFAARNLPWDSRRKSSYKENVELLKAQ